MAQNEDLEALADYASLAVDQLNNALEAARGIRDRAQAAAARGYREDDKTEIRRYLRFLTTGLGSAGRVLPDLSRKADELNTPSAPEQPRQLQSVKRPLHVIADEITSLWREPSLEARPYIYGLRHLATVTDKFGSDDAEDIILRFLGNARAWHGDDARRIKAELRAILAEAKAVRR